MCSYDSFNVKSYVFVAITLKDMIPYQDSGVVNVFLLNWE